MCSWVAEAVPAMSCNVTSSNYCFILNFLFLCMKPASENKLNGCNQSFLKYPIFFRRRILVSYCFHFSSFNLEIPVEPFDPVTNGNSPGPVLEPGPQQKHLCRLSNVHFGIGPLRHGKCRQPNRETRRVTDQEQQSSSTSTGTAEPRPAEEGFQPERAA